MHLGSSVGTLSPQPQDGGRFKIGEIYVSFESWGVFGGMLSAALLVASWVGASIASLASLLLFYGALDRLWEASRFRKDEVVIAVWSFIFGALVFSVLIAVVLGVRA